MQMLSEAAILTLIENRQPINARLRGSGLQLRVDEYVPLVCTVLHAGTELRPTFEQRLQLAPRTRSQLESVGTDALVELLPITLTTATSRLACDLNFPLTKCLRRRINNRGLWQRPPTKAMQQLSQREHQRFYHLLDALLDALEADHGHCLLIDLHGGAPGSDEVAAGEPKTDATPGLFHLIDTQVRMPDGEAVIGCLNQQLQALELPHIEASISRGEAPETGDYLSAHVNTRHEQTLTMPIQIQPVFRDDKGQLYPVMTDALQHGLHTSLYEAAATLARQLSNRRVSGHDLMPSQMPAEVLRLDQALKKLARGLETLLYINPINISREERRFLRNKGRTAPDFSYRQLRIDPFAHREKLYRLPVDRIREPALRQLYRDVIDTLAARIDLLVSIGTDRFLYNSLRYYGEPTPEDLANAHFLLHAADRPEEQNGPRYRSEEMVPFFEQKARDWGLECKVELSDRLLAQAMVNNGRKALMVRRSSQASESEMHALAHHELGVHMVTSLNAAAQPLKVFTLGLPGNTHAQEGLAILSEYLCGHLTLKRLKTLALRVVAVDQMLRHNDFCRTWRMLVEDHQCSEEEAFKITARVHRGGGFTKDHLYLSGFSQALKLWRSDDIKGLYVGKTGFSSLPLINELIARGLVEAPERLPDSLINPQTCSAEIAYLVNCIR
ncbi:flavohemoglobin expression-modulating QEGLA motif protein [Marinobacterium weihaiense]|uniref:Flavohemoglobin expression-modulating QEGLA motif protein n=1 Tax=Marinobacterium weihaiense TaxID=2851016 RepID=A0ABS6M8N1_9GAMM|nr:flavohemoglobin expression-modulating QEGLA motif protein [Marinobacterium weihaiense]MBV0932246.1 flavohemoglobin expression-modulating QEGLA motif protein [Marinobacterium weihaiense]